MKENDRLFVFLRHGIAEDGGPGVSDEQRGLTDDGHAQIEQVARGLARVFPDAEAVYASPLVRAAQTAQWVANAYGLDVTTAAALSTAASTEELIAFVETLSDSRAVLVGHEPSLLGILATLLGGDPPVTLKRGGSYALRIRSGGAATLEWLVTPTLL